MNEDLSQPHHSDHPSRPGSGGSGEVEIELVVEGDGGFEDEAFERPFMKYLLRFLVALLCLSLLGAIAFIAFYPDEAASWVGRPPSIEEIRQQEGYQQQESGVEEEVKQDDLPGQVDSGVSASQVKRVLDERRKERQAEYPGACFLSIEPWNVHVVFQGKDYTVENTFSVGDLLPGTYEMSISKEGYKTQVLEVLIEPNRITDLGRIYLETED